MEIIKLNLIPNGVNPTCHCSQYDEGRAIRIELFDGLTPYTLQSGDTVTLNVRKPDNTIVTTTVETTQGNNYVDIVTTEQICACVGYNLCDLTITNGSKVIGTLNFIMAIERDVLADGIPSQSVIKDLDALVQEAVGDNYYTKAETDGALALKANQSTTYTKTEVDSLQTESENHIKDNTSIIYSVDDKVINLENLLNISDTPLLRFSFGRFDTSGYINNGDKRWIRSQIFEEGKYTFPALPSGFEYNIFKYNSDSSGTSSLSYRTGSYTGYIDGKFIVNIRHEVNPNQTDFNYSEITNIRENFKITIYKGVKTFINNADTEVLKEFYLLDNSYTPYGLIAKSNMFRMKLKDSNNNIIVNGYNVAPAYYSDMVQSFVDVRTGNIVAYYVLHYKGTDYDIDSNSWSFTSAVTDVNNSPKIKEYLNREENIVLIGDSIFGFYALNVLEPLLRTITNKKIYNCGFGGCRMSWKEADGSDNYDVYSFVSVIDSIIANDYSQQIANMSLDNAYPLRVASLRSIDWSKPTTLLVNYVNNDFTAGVNLGDLWDYEDALTDFNKQTLLGAFNYGMKKLLTSKPEIKLIQFTSAWRVMGTNSEPPYVYTNSLNLKPTDYNEAIKNNATRIGISVYDFFNFAGRNYFNGEDVLQFDRSHYNEKGYKRLAHIIKALDESFID
jgi:hypothetical protein